MAREAPRLHPDDVAAIARAVAEELRAPRARKARRRLDEEVPVSDLDRAFARRLAKNLGVRVKR
jgi:hypothetical protein